MVDLTKEVETQDDFQSANNESPKLDDPSKYREETAAEMAAPVSLDPRRSDNLPEENALGGSGLGYLALAISIISLFVLPVLLGAVGIVVGFIARQRGAEGIGAWAIGIGIVSMIIGFFIAPFF